MWQLTAVNPLSDVRNPSKPPPRDRLPTADKMERMRHSTGADPTKVNRADFLPVGAAR